MESEWETLTLNVVSDRIAIAGEYQVPAPENQNREAHIVEVWDLETSRHVFDPLIFDEEHDFWIDRPRFIDDDSTLVVPEEVQRGRLRKQGQAEAHDSTRLHLFDAKAGRAINQAKEFPHAVSLLDFTPDRKRCLAMCESHE